MTSYTQTHVLLLLTREVKMLPTKTSRDVGMVDSVSNATGSSMEKPTGGKGPGTRRCIL